MPTYKVVLEIESDCDAERVQSLLTRFLSPDLSGVEACTQWDTKVLAVAETQSSRQSGQSSTD